MGQGTNQAAPHPPNARAVEVGSGIHLDRLSKSFGSVRAVDDVSVTIMPGETVAILGPNGAGKSTTIDMMLGLTRPDTGSVTLFGQEPARAIAAGAIGAMLQSGGLINDLSVRELIDLLASLYPHPLPVDEVLQITGITDIAARRTQKLSGGQSQRVRFAAALVSNPALIVLDEPTVAMDVEARRGFWATMRRFTDSGKTVVFATHYLEEADAFADRIVLMSHGRVVADGPTTEIKARVGGRSIRFTLPEAEVEALQALPGVSAVDVKGETVRLTCTDSDAAIRGLIAGFAAARDVEISGAGLEAAFLELTSDDHDETDHTAGAPA